MIEMLKNAMPGIFENIPIFPDQASTVAAEVDLLTFVWVVISFFSGTAVVGLMVFFALRYRRKSKLEVGGHETHAPMVEIASMAIPFVVCMAMFAWGAKVFIDLKRPPADAIEYFAFGKQWMWKYQHPNGKREINDLTIPVDTPIKMTMTSEDVIHSFFVPAFRVKQDVLPGSYTTVWFEATKPGVYRQMCAEYCGSEHSLMGGRVTVLEQEEYEAWLLGEEVSTTPRASGEQLFTSLACSTCHEAGSTGRGPSLHDIYGHPVALSDGQSVIADDTYLRESILNPRAKVKAGYSAIMPTFQGQVTEEEIFDLVSYIKSLELEPASEAGDAEVADSNDTDATPVASGG